MGRKQFKEDFTKAAEKYGPTAYIKDLQYDPETLCFSFEANGQTTSFTLYISDDYPDGTTLYPADGEPKYYSESITFILDDICTEYGQKFGIADIPTKTDREPETAKRTKLEANSPNKTVFFQDDDDENNDSDEDFELSPQLREEIAQMRKLYGTSCITERTFGTLDLLNLDLNVNYPFYASVASAWGVRADVPITIRMQLSPSMYLNSLEAPKIDILQDAQPCGLSTQLSFIVKNFCSENWTKFANTSLTTRQLKTSGTGIIVPEPKTIAKNPIDPSVQHLIEMGFAESAAQAALDAMSGDLEQATVLLLESPHIAPPSPPRFGSATPTTSLSAHAAESQHGLQERKGKSLVGLFSRSSSKKNLSTATPAPTSNTAPTPLTSTNVQERKDIFLQEQKDNEELKFVVDYSYGFLHQLHKYLIHRIPTLNKFCIICDRAHLFASSHLLRPAVCARELCCFAFQNLGVCAGATDGIATQAEVVDLLVCMAKAAAASTRRDTIFDPYPTVFDPFDSNIMVLNPSKKDFSKLDQILTKFPSVEDMTMAQEAKDMKEYMDSVDIYAFPLLQWVINSNRSHIEKLHASKHLKLMNTPHQYVLITAPPEKEKAFSALKAKYGTTFAFHGSPVENWHCILRTGLRNASGTGLQLNGAAYGKGIYLSPNATMSFGYSQRSVFAPRTGVPTTDTKSKSRFLSSSNFFCVALCEVANIPDIKKNGDIWVCPQEDPVVTRFFFVFPAGHTASPTAHTSNASFISEVHEALRER
eukprot:Phypoly_transcript_02469.p1 GENE.Phypoly_transcript_02469~~Phypoly_transcript_02469.p1  ORF type:complete len:782 (-),score=119.65 Phypoly_transcript_02469:460-2742(-)